ncbi:MAG TPA: N-acetyl-gamma-glutamyl-phosphate reductase [Candidatus Limnocylindria bacterium]|nr:N-acetyl-gamma-glutamyl-phosphate reductase [Candidatus Limnocylindria bacterium]
MAAESRVPVAVIGATGYVGAELLRFLVQHPNVCVVYASSDQYRGKAVGDVFPFLRATCDLKLEGHDPAVAASRADVVFLAVPHGTAVPLAEALLAKGRRVIDTSADFRLKDPSVYARWYGEHKAPQLLDEAVYGIPELYRARMPEARLIAGPGCYPTGALLGLVPLARAGLVTGPVIVDAKSGTTGAGRSAKVEQLFAEVNENFRAYAIDAHRHGPELEQELRAAGGTVRPLFVPHLLPVSRGILSTIYVSGAAADADIGAIFEQTWGKEPFIELRGDGTPPELRDVRGTNRCVIGWRQSPESRQAIVITAIDNLGKGAAGTAVQCLNVMLGLPETTGLLLPPLAP